MANRQSVESVISNCNRTPSICTRRFATARFCCVLNHFPVSFAAVFWERCVTSQKIISVAITTGQNGGLENSGDGRRLLNFSASTNYYFLSTHFKIAALKYTGGIRIPESEQAHSPRATLSAQSIARGRGGGTPLYGIYRYVLRQRVALK